ncbi:MAG TPA: hypothetical protein VK524_20990 [Polyangiaceae bacterium]|nr:hypothetical protein [Polyangiaceae bacterium]
MALGALLSACGGSPDGEGGATEPASEEAAIRAQNALAEAAAGLFYTLEIDDHHAIKFFAPGDGGYFVSEEMQLTQQSVLAKLGDTTAGAIFAALRPNEEVPPPIRELDEQGVTIAAPAVEDAPQDGSGFLEPESAVVDKHADSSGAHFESGHGFCPSQLNAQGASHTAFARVCWLNRMGNGSANASSTHSQGFLGAFVGNSGLIYSRGGATLLSITVLQGEVRWIADANPLVRNCDIFGCGDWFVPNRIQAYGINGGAGFHFGAAWVRASRHTRGFLLATTF